MMKAQIIASFFVLGLIVGTVFPANAQDVHLVVPGGEQAAEQSAPEMADPMNYFAASAHERKRMEEEKAQIPEGKVPASELQYLPEELEVDGKGTLKIENGRIIGGNNTAGMYEYCEDYKARGETVPDGCLQKLGAEKNAANMSAVPPQQATAAPIASQQPKSLDQQLQEKHGSVGAHTAAPSPVVPETTEPAHVQIENTAVVDKQRGSKTNIISNTDTGVQLSE